MKLTIHKSWDGHPAPASGVTHLTLSAEPLGLRIDVDAPFHDDPAPPGPAGPSWGLWDYEVVELFILGLDDRYTEIELGPHGHHLVLQLHGARNTITRELPLDFSARIHRGADGDRWTGTARIDRALLPLAPHRLNAYAIHGGGGARRYLARTPVPGPGPDFHRLQYFPAITLPT